MSKLTRKSSAGHTYFIQVFPDGPIKIGMTDSLTTRFSELQVGSPYELVPILVIPGVGNEKPLHGLFWYLRLRGEWFRPHGDLLAWIDVARSTASASLKVCGYDVPVSHDHPPVKRRNRWEGITQEEHSAINRFIVGALGPMLGHATSVKNATVAVPMGLA